MQQIQVTPPRWVRRLNIGFLVCGVIALAWLVYTLGIDRMLDGLSRLGWGFALSTAAFTCGILLDGVTMRACAVPATREVLPPGWSCTPPASSRSSAASLARQRAACARPPAPSSGPAHWHWCSTSSCTRCQSTPSRAQKA